MLLKLLKSFAILLLVVIISITLWILIFGWNWARAPIQNIVTHKTGRQLLIGGNLDVKLGWPEPHITAKTVTFSNPTWAKQKQMLTADEVVFSVDLLKLFKSEVVFPEVKLTKPAVFLEVSTDGRKSWLLDLQQSDEKARVPIGKLTLDNGELTYDDNKQNTSIHAELSTKNTDFSNSESKDKKNIGLNTDDVKFKVDGNSVVFKVNGLYKGNTLKADGVGGSVLSLHDQATPYPLKLDATIGKTTLKVDGTITSLLKLTAVDMQLAILGDNLASLFQFFDVIFPDTHAYHVVGHIKHSDKLWRFENFSGVIGKSDVAGAMQFDNGGKRPMMRGNLTSNLLDIKDLGPVIGAKKNPVVSKPNISVPTASEKNNQHILPSVPFKTDRWNTVDADVTLSAESILRDKALPLEDFVVHLKMQDSLLTLDPLDFGFAGGLLNGHITLDGKQNPIQAHAKVNVRKVILSKLFPTINLAHNSVGQINGNFNLSGHGNSVDRMLASANGRASLVVAKGKVSKLLIEKIGLHLPEILQLKIAGDKTINLNCAVADFDVKHGLMQANALILDTEISTIIGTGTVNLNQESLDLILNPKTRNTSLVALSTPIYVTGTFSNPIVEVNKGKIAARGLGAIALGILNPLLTLIPLLDAGPGVDSECGRIIKEAQAPLSKYKQTTKKNTQ